MRRRLNTRLLLWTLGCFMALAFLVNVLHGYQVRRNASYLRERGDLAHSQNDSQQALFFLGQYLALAPNDLDALEKYNLILDRTAFDSGSKVRVVLRLEDLLMRDPSRHEARQRLVRNLVELRRFKDAVVHLQALLAQGRDEANLRHLLGQCQAAAGNPKAAVATLTEAVRRDPTRIASYSLLAELLQDRLGKEDEAAEALAQMVAANPKNHKAYLARSRFAQRQGRLNDAIKDVHKAAELAPDDAGVLLAIAGWSQAEARHDDARRYLRRGVELHPDNQALVKALADLELRDGQPAEATRAYQAGVARTPDAFELRVRLTDLLIDEKKLAEAQEQIAAMERAGLPPTFPNYFRARIAISQDKWAEALALLEKARPELGAQTEWSSRVHALLGSCYEQLGDLERRLAAYQRAVQLEPGWTLAKFHLGLALLDAGRADDGLIELEAVGKAKDAPPAVWIALTRAQLQAALRRPGPARDWRRVDESLASALRADPSGPETKLLRAEVLLGRGDLAEARAALASADAGNARVWILRAEVETQAGQFDDGLALLHEAARTLGDSVELRLARARLHGRRGNDEDRVALRKLAEEIESQPLEARTRLWRALGDIWQGLGHHDAADVAWRQLARLQPDDTRSRLLLLESALRKRAGDEAERLVAELRRVEGEQGNLWRWGTVAVQLLQANGRAEKLAEARVLLAELARRQRDWPRVPLLEARIDELEGKWDRALANRVRAVELGERDLGQCRRLVQQLLARRLATEAERVLLLLEDQGPLPADLARQAAEAALATRNAPRLRYLIGQLYPTTPRDHRDLIWLARMHSGLDDAIKAEAMLSLAVQRAEHLPETWTALVEHLARTGKHREIEAVIGQMTTKMPAKRLEAALARCWDASGDPARAEVAYAKVLAAQPNDFSLLSAAADFYRRADRPDRAAPLYERLLEPSIAAPPDVQADARRRLALLRGASGHGSSAIALLDVNRQTIGEQSADRRVRWYLESRDAASRVHAMQQLKDSFSREPSAAEEEMLLIALQELSDPAAARDRLAQLLVVHETPQLIAWHIRLLAKAQATSEAVVWLAKLERWEPTSPRTLEVKQLVVNSKS